MPFQPWGEVAGQAQVLANGGRRGVVSLDEGLDIGGLHAGTPVRIEVGRQPGAHRSGLITVHAGPGQDRDRPARPAQENLDPPGAFGGRLAKGANALAAQTRQHAFYVLAGSQAVHLMVDAAASVIGGVKGADFDLIGGPALRPRPERPKDGMIRLHGLNRRDLGAPAPASQIDLVLVAGVPALGRGRPLKDGSRPPALPCSPALRSRR